MKRSALLRSAFCVTALLASVVAVSAQDRITNGGFDVGGFSGWTVVDSSDFTLIGSNPAFSHSPNNYALLGASPTTGSLSQTFNTVASDSFTLSFWLASDRTPSGPVDNSFDVLWNGVSILSLVNVPAPSTTNPYMNYTFTNLAASSGSTSTLEFRYVNNDDYFRLDDVSVVPEASSTSFALLGLGLMGVAAYRKRRSGRLVASV